MFRVLIVEDDQKVAALYESFLQKQKYETVCAKNANEAIGLVSKTHFDIMLCDIMIPGMDGVMLVETVRKKLPELPVIMLTALGDFKTKKRAFTAGGDDYMVKPVDLNELVLRMSALLRRAHSASEHTIIIGDAVLDSDSLSVVEGNRAVTLPPKEFMILFKMCSQPDHIFTRRDIMKDVWGMYLKSGERTVDVHIRRLRIRFSDSESFRIDTVRGIGYKVVVLK